MFSRVVPASDLLIRKFSVGFIIFFHVEEKMNSLKVIFQTVSQKVRDQGLRNRRNEAYLRYAAMTRVEA